MLAKKLFIALTALAIACESNNNGNYQMAHNIDDQTIDLPADVNNPELYLTGRIPKKAEKFSGMNYILAESVDQGCTLAIGHDRKGKYRNAFIYSGEDCDNISLYVHLLTEDDLGEVVRRGKTRGELKSKINLGSLRISEQESDHLTKEYLNLTDIIRETHMK